MRNHHLQIIVLLLFATLYATASIAAGLPAPQDVLDQLKKLYPNPIGAEIFPKGDQFEVLFLSPDHPTSCLVDVATHRLSNCHYDDVESQQQSLGKGVTAGVNRAAVASDPCIDVKQTRTFSFEGVLAYKVFAGPPNYEDVRRGDTPEPTYILQLNRPICVSGDDFIFKDQKN